MMAGRHTVLSLRVIVTLVVVIGGAALGYFLLGKLDQDRDPVRQILGVNEGPPAAQATRQDVSDPQIRAILELRDALSRKLYAAGEIGVIEASVSEAESAATGGNGARVRAIKAELVDKFAIVDVECEIRPRLGDDGSLAVVPSLDGSVRIGTRCVMADGEESTTIERSLVIDVAPRVTAQQRERILAAKERTDLILGIKRAGRITVDWSQAIFGTAENL